MSKEALYIFTALTIIAVMLIGVIIHTKIFNPSTDIILLGIAALFSEFCGVLVLWIDLLREKEFGVSKDI